MTRFRVGDRVLYSGYYPATVTGIDIGIDIIWLQFDHIPENHCFNEGIGASPASLLRLIMPHGPCYCNPDFPFEGNCLNCIPEIYP